MMQRRGQLGDISSFYQHAGQLPRSLVTVADVAEYTVRE